MNSEKIMTEEALLAALYAETQQRFASASDPAHNWEHVKRVYNLALLIAEREGANRLIVGLAALMHDLGRLAVKDTTHHAERSTVIAVELFASYEVPAELHEPIVHAIRAHSYKKGIEPQTLEAKVLRDADKLDTLGAVGIMRWAISTSRRQNIDNYHPVDPFAEQRAPDESKYMLDRFFSKLLQLRDSMLTPTGQALARQRIAFMQAYLDEFRRELAWEAS